MPPPAGVPGLRPLVPVYSTPEDYPSGSGRCGCTWMFNTRMNMFQLKYVKSDCTWSEGEEGPHYLLAITIMAAQVRDGRR